MPRRARLVFPGVPLHVIHRGNNRQAIFFTPDDHRQYLDWLGQHAREAGCAIHAFVLMTNHVHLLLTPADHDSLPALMKPLAQRYTQRVNRIMGRSGTLWEGRYKSCLVEEERYLLTCQRYMELNPVRAGMVRHPAEYPWSSHRHHALGDDTGTRWLRPHAVQQALGGDESSRRSAYRALFDKELSSDELDEIRLAVNRTGVLARGRLLDQVREALGGRLPARRPGRPPRP